MKAYLTWDTSGEYLWLTTPYKNNKTLLWESEHDTPKNKIKVIDGTLEFYCWEAINIGINRTIYKLNQSELKEIQQYAIA